MRDSLLRALAVGALFAMGCGGYTSEYAPPADGRPRLIWRDDGPVSVMADDDGKVTGYWAPPGCTQAVDEALRSSSTGAQGSWGAARTPTIHVVPRPPGGFWQPILRAPDVHIGAVPHVSGSGGHVGAVPHVGGSGGHVGAVPHVSSGGSSGGGGRSGGGGGGSGGGGGGGGGSGGLGEGVAYVAIIGAAVAIVALPFVTLSLALSRPEPELATAMEIDSFNAHTDVARVQGSPCDDTAVVGEDTE